MPMSGHKTKRDFKSSIHSEAHGRVNLIGEHTDYNDGFVLPTSIPQSTIVQIRGRDDGKVVMQSESGSRGSSEEYMLGTEKKNGGWTDYVQGVTWLVNRDVTPLKNGFEITIESSVPMGSGLSSSAALLVALFRAIRDCFDIKGLDDIRISQLSQKVENEFVGARVGIMDPMAASLASENVALFIDTQTLKYERIAIPTGKMEIAVINSGIAHRLSAGSYNQRREECEKACELLGIKSLREISVKDIDRINKLPEPYNRRAKHVVTENERVLKAVECLRQGDCETLGLLFKESHLSMSEDYKVSLPEIDTLVKIADAQEGVYGARLTGGGFGGSIVLIAKKGQAAAAADKIARLYREATGQKPQVLVPMTPLAGVR